MSGQIHSTGLAKAVTASIIVPCKGRLHHLRQTLPTMLAQQCPFDWEVVVVDYDCPQETFAWCKSLNLRRLVVGRTAAGSGDLSLSHAKNCGAALASGGLLAFVDADMRLDANWLQVAGTPVLDGRAGLTLAAFGVHQGWDRGGTCVVDRELFHRVRGYDEQLPKVWGSYYDLDLFHRCSRLASQLRYPGILLSPIKHNHAERIRHFDQTTLNEGRARSIPYLRRRTGEINPHGYGEGITEVFRGTQDTAPPASWTRRPRLHRGPRQRFT